MRKTRVVRPDYERQFRCIGAACEDTCCEGWQVNVDSQTYSRYRALPAGPLRDRIDEFIVPVESLPRSKPSADARGGEASIRLVAGARCPFLAESRLCRIQSELGENYLSETCSSFPRRKFSIDKIEERTLSLSCPEAARLVLLSPALPADETTYNIAWNDSHAARLPLRSYFWPIREFSLRLIRNRAYPLWQRLFLLGVFAGRLEALARGRLDRGFARLLDDFSRAVNAGTLRAEMETIRPNPGLQLEMVLCLIQLGTRPGFRSERFNECLRAFVEGVGRSRNPSPEEQAAAYSRGFAEFYRPFFELHPEILENYLANQIFRELYPFGLALMDPTAEPKPANAFALLALQFAILKGLLIGTAAFRRDRFTLEWVIQTVQTAYKHFEHCPGFLAEAHQALAARGLDSLPGLTALVRN